MSFSIRAFHKDDFETLWCIDQECFAPGISYSRQELSSYLRLAGSFGLVAEVHATQSSGTKPESSAPDHARIVGFVVAHASRLGLGHIITIDILPSARRCGAGSLLLAAAEDRLRAGHCTAIQLETAVNNTAALAFYKRHSYFLVKTMPRYYPDGLDAFVLRKDLL